MQDNIQTVQVHAPVQFVDNTSLRPTGEEKNDCVTRSIASAFNASYADANQLAVDRMAKVEGKGINTAVLNLVLAQIASQQETVLSCKVERFDKIKTYYKNAGSLTERSMTLGTFLKEHTSGTFLVGVRGHMLVIKDGVIHGNADDCKYLKRRIDSCFEVKSVEKKEPNKQLAAPVKSKQDRKEISAPTEKKTTAVSKKK